MTGGGADARREPVSTIPPPEATSATLAPEKGMGLETLNAAERSIVQEALGRGWLQPGQLNEALQVHAQQRAGGQTASLLAILGAGYLRPEHVQELTQTYRRLIADGEATQPPERVPMPVSPPAAPGTRERVLEALEQVLRVDPQYAPHVQLVLERLETLGEGGMGVVYRVRDQRLGRDAALKLIRTDRASEGAVHRFRREVEITARLEHPSIPPVYEAGTNTSGEPFMLMRVIEGQPLSERIEAFHVQHHSLRREERALRVLLEALIKVGEAVGYAHSQNVVHRDLKPANVMVGRFGEVMVMDWGLGKDLSASDAEDTQLRSAQEAPPQGESQAQGQGAELTQAGSILGTLGYMPPEQIEGVGVDQRADVFALGALLSCVLTERPPVDGDSFANRITATLAGRISHPRDRRPDVPPELNSIAAKALAADPRERTQSAKEFVADLQAYLAGAPVSVHRYSARERWLRVARAHVTLLVGLGVSTVALLVVGLALAFGLRAESERALAKTRQEQAEEQERQAEAHKAQAQSLQAKAEESAAALADERAANLVYTDGGRLKLLVQRALRGLSPSTQELPAFQRWTKEARSLLDPQRVGQHRARLKQLELLESSSRSTAQEAEQKALVGLLAGLASLGQKPAPDASALAGSVASVASRHALARVVHELTVGGVEAKAAWDEARGAFRGGPPYLGLRLEPVEGLLPLGRDPASGLWEFWHVASGARPQRSAEGAHRLAKGDGMVLVLVPGGSFRMGGGYKSETPVHEVALKPFFLSKYEMTQGQWLRATGMNPSQDPPGQRLGLYRITSLHPVEQVSWEEATRVLDRLGLALPSEAQWEYAARAKTSTRWWTGNEIRSLDGAENLADASARNQKVPWVDGYRTHSPAGSFRANGFGLHDMGGNLGEWIHDTYSPNYQGAPTDGSAWVLPSRVPRVYRGGTWIDGAAAAQSAHRGGYVPSGRHYTIGVRAAKPYP